MVPPVHCLHAYLRASCVAASWCYSVLTLRRLLFAETVDWINARDPPKWLWRTVAALVLGGQVLTRVLQGVLPSS